MRKKTRLNVQWGLLGITLLLIGCKGTTALDEQSGIMQGKQLKVLTERAKPSYARFVAEGKIALRYPRVREYRQDKQESLSASLIWQHTNDKELVKFYDPTDREALTLTYYQNEITLEDSSGSSTFPKDELAKRLGTPIPIDIIREWLFSGAYNGNDTQLTTNGWRVSLKDWKKDYYQRITLVQNDYFVRIYLQKVVPF